MSTIRRDSALTPVADPVTIDSLGGSNFLHCFLGVQFFDGTGDRIAATAGALTITVQTECPLAAERPPDASIDATAPTTVGWTLPTDSVTLTPDGSIATAVTYKAVLFAHKSC